MLLKLIVQVRVLLLNLPAATPGSRGGRATEGAEHHRPSQRRYCVAQAYSGNRRAGIHCSIQQAYATFADQPGLQSPGQETSGVKNELATSGRAVPEIPNFNF